MFHGDLRLFLSEELENSGFDEKVKQKSFEIFFKLEKNLVNLSNFEQSYLSVSIIFLALCELNRSENFKNLADSFGLDSKKLAIKTKEVALYLNIKNPQKILEKGLRADKTNKQELHNQHKEYKPVYSEDLSKINNNEWINIFKNYTKFIESLFTNKNKDFIEIKTYLKILTVNLTFSGYKISEEEIEQKFGELFIHLNLEPKKGRESDKFVKLKDRFGNFEPYTLIKLGE